VDKFAVAVTCKSSEHRNRADAILNGAGAEQVRDMGEED